MLIERIRQRAVDPATATDQSARFPRRALAPIEPRAIVAAEAAVGQSLPQLLREVYLAVANGGVGPGYGLLPLVADGETESVVSLYSVFTQNDPEHPAWRWPNNLLPFCDWGCAIRSCVDCAASGTPVWTFDPGSLDDSHDVSGALVQTHAKLSDWFTDWLGGVKLWDLMFEPDFDRAREGINPITGKSMSFVPSKLRRR